MRIFNPTFIILTSGYPQNSSGGINSGIGDGASDSETIGGVSYYYYESSDATWFSVEGWYIYADGTYTYYGTDLPED